MFSPLVSSMGYCAASEVKLETSFLLEIQKWIDNFTPFERTTSKTGLQLMGHLWNTFFEDTISFVGYDCEINTHALALECSSAKQSL